MKQGGANAGGSNYFFLWVFLSLGLFFCASAIFCIGQEGGDSDKCLSCHGNAVNFDKKFLHPLVKQGKCRQCHTDYDETGHIDRVKPVFDTCVKCHSQEKLGRSHPAGEGVTDPNTNDTMTCVSSCHLPHGSDYKYQLPFKNNMELCLSCHKEF